MRSAQVDGLLLAIAREDRGLTTIRFAELLSQELGRRVWQSTVSRIELGDRQPGPAMFAAMLRVLRCEKSELLVSESEARSA